MATRSNIAIVLNKEDLNRPFTLLDVIDRFDLDEDMIGGSGARSPKHEDWEDIFTEVTATDEKPVLQIYCHWDGYPEGVGAELLENFNSYEKALALVMAGDTSSVSAGQTQCYSLGQGEEYEGQCEPSFQEAASEDEEYLYVWRDGKWTLGETGRDLAKVLGMCRAVDASLK